MASIKRIPHKQPDNDASVDPGLCVTHRSGEIRRALTSPDRDRTKTGRKYHRDCVCTVTFLSSSPSPVARLTSPGTAGVQLVAPRRGTAAERAVTRCVKDILAYTYSNPPLHSLYDRSF
ncbi:hypothetical protein JOB18_036414 [Solea senegalensis]|uniref:Uncharacterized protein n=1 Tax=Solea senegalensis TaxID=28829 RepID=A0AAV6QWE0_SOLSE|nr:hypothetical protein JOB18_036414 [Solea senegalensis]